MEDFDRAKLGTWEKVSYWMLLGPLFPSFLLLEVLEEQGFGFWERLGVTTMAFVGLAYLVSRPAAVERSRRIDTDLKRGIFNCAIRYPNSVPGSLRDRWDTGVARYNDDVLVFQPHISQGGPQSTPTGTAHYLGKVEIVAPVIEPSRRAPELRRNWQVVELRTEKFGVHLAAAGSAIGLL